MNHYQFIFEYMLIEDLQLVLKVAEFRNITAAATHLDMQPATASAALKRVEKSLGTELFIRSTRQLRLSAAGERYLPQCQQALHILQQAQQNISHETDVIEGELRIALSSDLGRNVVLPWLDDFIDQHPKISLKANISDSNVDFYRDAVDVALRYGSPQGSNVYGFKISDIPGTLCASPDYLQQMGTPQHPNDLKKHNGLFYQLYDVIHDTWTFTQGQNKHKIQMQGNRASNDGDLVRRWCVAGQGLAVKSCLDMADDLLNGRVINVMTGYQARSTELWLICPTRQSITPAMRLLRDSFRSQCKQIIDQLRVNKILNPQAIHTSSRY